MSINTIFSLKNLLQEGTLGLVYLTMHAQRVAEILGEPEYKGGESNKHRWPNIWRYGDLELLFERPMRLLSCIVINYATAKHEFSSSISIEPWILQYGLSANDFVIACSDAGIVINELAEPWNDDCREFVSEMGVHLIFDERGLIKLTCSDRDLY